MSLWIADRQFIAEFALQLMFLELVDAMAHVFIVSDILLWQLLQSKLQQNHSDGQGVISCVSHAGAAAAAQNASICS